MFVKVYEVDLYHNNSYKLYLLVNEMSEGRANSPMDGLRRGLYVIKGPSGTSGEFLHYLFVDNRDDIWFAKNPRGEGFGIDTPQGMPDSERMPDGEINFYDLEPISASEAREEISRLGHVIFSSSRAQVFLQRKVDEAP